MIIKITDNLKYDRNFIKISSIHEIINNKSTILKFSCLGITSNLDSYFNNVSIGINDEDLLCEDIIIYIDQNGFICTSDMCSTVVIKRLVEILIKAINSEVIKSINKFPKFETKVNAVIDLINGKITMSDYNKEFEFNATIGDKLNALLSQTDMLVLKLLY